MVKNRINILFILCTFLLFNSNLYGLSNKYLSFDTTDCDVEEQSDKNITLNINIDSSDDEESENNKLKPSIEIQIKDLDKPQAVQYNQKELDSLKEALKKGAFTQYINTLLKIKVKANEEKSRLSYYSSGNYKMKTHTEKVTEEEKILNEIKNKSSINDGYISELGKHKAFTFDFNVEGIQFKRFIIISFNHIYTIECAYPKGYDISSTNTYKDFVKSFKVKDKLPTTFNMLIYRLFGKNTLLSIIVIILSIPLAIFKFMKRR